jgi:hypothetical protein
VTQAEFKSQPQPQPHSRWRLKDRVDRLAVSYDAACAAVDAFTGSTLYYDPLAPRPTIRARIRASVRYWVALRGWARACWFVGTGVLAGVFMAWISLRILEHFMAEAPPAILAMVPGALLTAALVGTAALTGDAMTWLARQPSPRRYWPQLAWPGLPFATCLACCAAWVTIWAASVAGIAVWPALTTGVLSGGLTGAALLCAGRPAPSHAVAALPAVRCPVPPPRRLLAQQRHAQDQMRRHARSWSIAAHLCGVATEGAALAQTALVRLLAGDPADLSLDGIGVFHAQLLTVLSRYRPDPLETRLQESSRRLLPREGRL